MQHTMLFLRANGNIPFGRITSTARMGHKWANLVTPGDTLNFQFTEDGVRFGRAVVTKVEMVPFLQVIERAEENHAAGDFDTFREAQEALTAGLCRAYGDLHPAEPFTMVHFIRVNSESRDSAYAAIDSERDYQEALRASASSPGDHPVEAFLLFMDGYMNEAKKTAAFDWSPDCIARVLASIRKVAALGVACMEKHGAPRRAMPSPQGVIDRVSKAV